MAEALESRRAAFDGAIAEHGPRIRAGVHSLIRNREDAEDIIAEINLALWTSLPKFGGASSLGTFVYAMAHHKIIDHLRRKYREARLNRRAAESAAAAPERPADPDPGIKVELLTPAELVVLRLLARGLKNQEIALTLFRSTNTVRTHVKRINAKLGTRNRAEAAYVFGRCAGR